MLEVMQFIFSSFWIWLGTLTMFSVILIGIVATIGELKSKKTNDTPRPNNSLEKN